MVQQLVDQLATSVAVIQIHFHPSAVCLPNFPRAIQTDNRSCGEMATWVCLQYFGVRCTHNELRRLLGTNSEGTSVSSIKKTFRSFGFRILEKDNCCIRDVRQAIKNGTPMIASVHRGGHYLCIWGISKAHVFVSDSSLNFLGMGRLGIAVPKAEWQKIFDRWVLIVKPGR